MQTNRSKRIAARGASLSAALCLVAALGACTTLGTGFGTLASNSTPVSFAWKSKDGGVTGTMSATLADGTMFSGPYLENTSTTMGPDLTPMWDGWSQSWDDWSAGLNGIDTTYSGNVLANLKGPAEQRMRCHFTLNAPASGMGGGGLGQCQLPGGQTVAAAFPSN
jgi:hypothetical protein